MREILLKLSILIWPFGLLLYFQMPNGQNLYLLDFISVLLFISLTATSARKNYISDRLFRPLIIFESIAVISLLIAIPKIGLENILIPFQYLLRLIVYPSFYFAVKSSSLENLKKYLLTSIIIFLVLGLLQYLLLPDMRYLKFLGFDDHYFRLIGSILDPNFTGVILASVALFLIGINREILSLPVIGLLALTFSRASYLSFFICLSLAMIIKKKKWFVFLIIFLALVIYLIPKPFGEGVNLARTFSIFSRINSWKDGLNLFLSRPIFGWGYNTLNQINGVRYQIDNSFIYVLTTTGIVGFISFICLLFQIYKLKLRLFAILVITTILIHSQFNNSLFLPWIFSMFWIVVGLGSKEYKKS